MKKEITKQNLLGVVTQAFYGNRTFTTIREDNLDAFILGYQDTNIEISEKIDRTIIHLPNSKCVLIYNKYEEARQLEQKEKLKREENYILKPLAFIPELNLEIYSRCLICRMDQDGNLLSIKDEDDNIVFKYLSK